MQRTGAPRRYTDGCTQYHFSGPKKLYDEFIDIVLREGDRASTKIQEFMAGYVKNHSEGNPSFVLDKWVDDSEFKAIPTLNSEQEKWDKYLSRCDEDELVGIEGQAHFIKTTASEYWKKKKTSKLPPRKTGLERIQDALDKDNGGTRGGSF